MPRPTAATLAAAAVTTRRPLLRPAALTHATTHITLATPGTLAIDTMGAVGARVIAARGAAAAAATVAASPAAGVPPETPTAETQVTQRPPTTLFRRHHRPLLYPPLKSAARYFVIWGRLRSSRSLKSIDSQ